MASGSKAERSGLAETVIIVVQALAIALLVRMFFYQPFNIPSGSMKKTLLEGDYLFVSKLSYGYSKYSFHTLGLTPDLFGGRIFSAEPQRGDVAVFKLPVDNSTDYIKRVIGLPGDEIQMKDGQLFINGQAVPKEPAGEFLTDEDGEGLEKIPVFKETLPNGVSYNVLDGEENGPLDNTSVYKVPDGHYFMMGDNRDNSTDSRVRGKVGSVPLENFIGRAEIIFFSAPVNEPDKMRWYSPWNWPFDIRWSRFFNLVR
jgi:signal peptidase I